MMTILCCAAGVQTVERLLQYSEGDLVRRTGLLLREVRMLVQLASEAVLDGHTASTALHVYRSRKALPHQGELDHDTALATL